MRAEIQMAPTNTGIITADNWHPSQSFLDRLRVSYRASLEGFVSETSVIWSDNSFISLRKPVHDALLGERDDLADLLANPAKTNLYYGVDNLALNLPVTETAAKDCENFNRGELQRLAVALGILRVWNPGGGHQYHPGEPEKPIDDAEIVVSKLAPAFDFPAPFPGEVALMTSRGPVSYRAIQAIYQAHRLAQIASTPDGKRCVEIGAGMGRTAYYAYRLGFHDYTVVDLPTALVGQACFLAATLGEEAVSLPGEKLNAPIKLRAPQWIDGAHEPFDICLNVDSLTEMSESYARGYVDFVFRNCRAFLSINHEANDFTARDLVGDRFLTRHPYPMRAGYVEEFWSL